MLLQIFITRSHFVLWEAFFPTK